jgi:AraC family transcriptional regulator
MSQSGEGFIVSASDQPRPKNEATVLIRGAMAPWQVRCIQAYVAANLHSSIRVMDVIRVVQFKPNGFDRIFKKSFGCTPHRYVMRRRIERAKSLLLMSDDLLSKIASECGFGNRSHLSNLFHKTVGESPGRWRRRHRQLTC